MSKRTTLGLASSDALFLAVGGLEGLIIAAAADEHGCHAIHRRLKAWVPAVAHHSPCGNNIEVCAVTSRGNEGTNWTRRCHPLP
eukprot:4851529-Amphidinium_carterae.1